MPKVFWNVLAAATAGLPLLRLSDTVSCALVPAAHCRKAEREARKAKEKETPRRAWS